MHSCTLVTKRMRKHRKLLLKGILRLIIKKRKFWHNFENSGDKAPYRRVCADVQSAIKKFHVQQESELLCQNDRKNLFKYVNNNLGNKNNPPVENTLSDGSQCYEPLAMNLAVILMHIR